jgi:phage gp29-like protein
VHHDVTVARSYARAVEISAVFRSRVLMPYVCRNYGMEAALKFTPEFRVRVETRPDMYNASQSVKMLLDAGMQTIPVSWVHDVLQIPVPVDGEPVVVLPLMPGLPGTWGDGNDKKPRGPVAEGKPNVNDSPGATASNDAGQEDDES